MHARIVLKISLSWIIFQRMLSWVFCSGFWGIGWEETFINATGYGDSDYWKQKVINQRKHTQRIVQCFHELSWH